MKPLHHGAPSFSPMVNSCLCEGTQQFVWFVKGKQLGAVFFSIACENELEEKRRRRNEGTSGGRQLHFCSFCFNHTHRRVSPLRCAPLYLFEGRQICALPDPKRGKNKGPSGYARAGESFLTLNDGFTPLVAK